MDLKSLQEQREQLDAQITAAQKENRGEALKEIKSLMATFNITVEDLVKGNKSKSTSGKKVAPKFKHVPTGATWTGRGKTPKWYSEDSANVLNLQDAPAAE